ncbi:MAG: hypothetical protein UY16_C0050G0001, partial [Candidatus Gottesmanbacteria bacterium GW2011_GWA2_47_9]
FGDTGTATTAGNLVFSGTAPTITTTKMAPLTIGDASTGPIQLSPKGTTGLNVTGTGTVGIGTTGPGSITEISKASLQYWVPGSNTWNGITAGNLPSQALTLTNTQNSGYDPVLVGRMTTSTGTSKIAFAIGAVGASNWIDGTLATQIADIYFINRDSSGNLQERMRINSSGNVGIGTTSPLEKLDVSGNATVSGNLTFTGAASTIANRKMQPIQIGDSATGNINFYSTSNSITSGGNLTLAGTISLPNSNTLTGVANYLRLSQGLSVGGADTYYFDSSGNINANAGTFAGTLTTNGTLTVNSDTITLGNAITDALTFTARVAQDSDLLPIGTTGTNDLGSSLLPWDNIYGVTLYQNGNSVCDVTGNCSAATDIWSQANGALFPKNGLSTTNMAPLTLGGASTGPIQLSPKGTTGLFVNGSGNVGIGTTGPDAPLSFTNAVGTKINFYDGLNYDIGIQSSLMEFIVPNDTADFAFGYGSSGSLTRIVTIKGTGLVGIGTTTPTAKLDVAGDASTSASLVFRHATAPTIDTLNGTNLAFAFSPGGDAGLVTKLTLNNNGDLTLANSEVVSNATDDIIAFSGAGGTDNTDLYMDMDGTYPVLYSNTDTKVGIDDDLEFVGDQTISGTGALTVTPTTTLSLNSTGDMTLDSSTDIILDARQPPRVPRTSDRQASHGITSTWTTFTALAISPASGNATWVFCLPPILRMI